MLIGLVVLSRDALGHGSPATKRHVDETRRGSSASICQDLDEWFLSVWSSDVGCGDRAVLDQESRFSFLGCVVVVHCGQRIWKIGQLAGIHEFFLLEDAAVLGAFLGEQQDG